MDGLWLLTLALSVAGVGQVLIGRGVAPAWVTPALWLLAAVLAVAAWGQRPLAAAGAAVPQPAASRRVIVASLLLLPIAWAGAADNTFRWWGVAAWVGSLIVWLWGWGALTRLPPADRQPWRRWQLAAFTVIVFAAALFRFWDIGGLPQEMTSDHTEKLHDVQDILDGMRPIFFERNTGREPLQLYFAAFVAGPLGFGVSHTALKVSTALISLLTIPLMYLLARRGLGLPRTAALLAMALLALSKWHVEISRIGLRFPLAPLGVALTLMFFLRALRGHQRRDWLLAGAAVAVALHGYTPSRIIPVLLAVGSVVWLLLEQTPRRTGLTWRQALTNVALLPLTALIGFLPLLRYSVDNPAKFWFRSTTRVFGVDGESVDVSTRLLENSWNGLRMFHYRGDEVWVNALRYDPVLDPATGSAFVVGAAIVLATAVRRWRATELTLLLALPVLLLPSILALAWPRENPSVVRASGALPVVMLVSVLPLWAITEAVARRWPSHQRRYPLAVCAAVVVAAFAGIAQQNAAVYFGPYAKQYLESASNSTEIARAVARHAGEIGGIDHAYLLLWPHWVDARAVGINMGAPRWENVLSDASAVNDPRLQPVPKLVALPLAAKEDLARLQRLWPGARTALIPSRVPSKSFYVIVRAR